MRRARRRRQEVRLADVEHLPAFRILNVKHRVVADLRRRPEPLVPGRDHAPVLDQRHFEVRLDAVFGVDRARRVANLATVRTKFQSSDARLEQERVVLQVAEKIVVRFTAAGIRRLAEHQPAARFRIQVVLDDEGSERPDVGVQGQPIRVFVGRNGLKYRAGLPLI